MRILLASHLPPESPAGNVVTRLGLDLRALGHTVRTVIVDRRAEPEDSSVRRVVCSGDAAEADLAFAVPAFTADEGGQLRFAELSDAQIAAYRETLRHALDAEIDQFDPHVIHCEHVWLFGHLALESGVPYVLSARGPELTTYEEDPRYSRFVAEAAENAGRVIAINEVVANQVRRLYGDIDGRIVVARPVLDQQEKYSSEHAGQLADIYGQVLDERLGRRRGA